jgi:hypothetical protein
MIFSSDNIRINLKMAYGPKHVVVFILRTYKYSCVKTALHASFIPVLDHTTGMSLPKNDVLNVCPLKFAVTELQNLYRISEFSYSNFICKTH